LRSLAARFNLEEKTTAGLASSGYADPTAQKSEHRITIPQIIALPWQLAVYQFGSAPDSSVVTVGLADGRRVD